MDFAEKHGIITTDDWISFPNLSQEIAKEFNGKSLLIKYFKSTLTMLMVSIYISFITVVSLLSLSWTGPY